MIINEGNTNCSETIQLEKLGIVFNVDWVQLRVGRGGAKGWDERVLWDGEGVGMVGEVGAMAHSMVGEGLTTRSERDYRRMVCREAQCCPVSHVSVGRLTREPHWLEHVIPS